MNQSKTQGCRNLVFSLTAFGSLLFCSHWLDAQDQKKLPREDVISVPAIGKDLCVSNIFQSNMVIQRDQPISIWGWADPGEKIQVKVAKNAGTTEANQERFWKVTMPAMPASKKAISVSIQGAEKKIVLNNILVGDVWVLGGQSNMEFPLSRVENGQLEIISANYPQIRILTVPALNGPEKKASFPRLQEWSSWFGRHFRKGDWEVCSPDVVRELSAIGYVFARRIHTASQVPIGIIDASRGGTTVETWTPETELRSIKSKQVTTLLADWNQKVAAFDAAEDLAGRVKRFKQRVARIKKEGKQLPANEKEPTDLRPGPAMDQNRPGNCYASMIGPLEGLQIKGAIFHQGYNNCFNGTEGAIMYRQVFPKMIRAWRNAFGNPEMPFGIISLCTEGAVQSLDNYTEMMANPGPYIREAQYQTFLEFYQNGDKNIGFVSTYDLRRRWYHPQLKIPAGERIARWALATQYGFEREIRWKPPMVMETKTEDGQIVLTLDEPASGVDDGGPIVGFAIAGKDGKFHPADATHLVVGEDNRGRPRHDKKSLVLKTPMVEHPVHYRYAWGRSPLGNLQADRQTDIPFATQRSDDWPLENVPGGVLGEVLPDKIERGHRRKIQEAMRELDAKRKLFYAKQLQSSSENK